MPFGRLSKRTQRQQKIQFPELNERLNWKRSSKFEIYHFNGWLKMKLRSFVVYLMVAFIPMLSNHWLIYRWYFACEPNGQTLRLHSIIIHYVLEFYSTLFHTYVVSPSIAILFCCVKVSTYCMHIVYSAKTPNWKLIRFERILSLTHNHYNHVIYQQRWLDAKSLIFFPLPCSLNGKYQLYIISI